MAWCLRKQDPVRVLQDLRSLGPAVKICTFLARSILISQDGECPRALWMHAARHIEPGHVSTSQLALSPLHLAIVRTAPHAVVIVLGY